ncbi:MAG TPA: hypothetical protein DEO85_15005 [Maritimibacter sp.]|nr:hypothetical protein [Maritimibacter sp.]
MIPNPFARFGICLPKAFFFVAVLVLAFAQPVKAQVKFTFGDRIPSFHGGYYIDGIPSIHFIDTGENRFQKAGRTFKQTIGGPAAWGKELAEIGLFPFQEPVIAGAAALGVGAIVANDHKITAFYQDKIEPAFDWFTPDYLFRPGPNAPEIVRGLAIEDQYILLGMGLTYAYGFAFNDERAQAAALLSAKAVTYSFITTQLVLKPIIGRMRPVPGLSSYSGTEADARARDYSTSPYLFGKAPGIQVTGRLGTAFPSYHYTQYFAIARVYSGVYDNSWIPYALAGVAAVSNIRGHNHWVSDMAAGAVVGTVIGQTVLNNYSERKGINMTVTPSISTKSVGAQFSMTF